MSINEQNVIRNLLTFVGRGGSLVYSSPFVQKVVGLNPSMGSFTYYVRKKITFFEPPRPVALHTFCRPPMRTYKVALPPI